MRRAPARPEWYIWQGGNVPVTTASFVTDNALKCTISRVQIPPLGKVVILTGFNHKYHLDLVEKPAVY